MLGKGEDHPLTSILQGEWKILQNKRIGYVDRCPVSDGHLVPDLPACMVFFAGGQQFYQHSRFSWDKTLDDKPPQESCSSDLW